MQRPSLSRVVMQPDERSKSVSQVSEQDAVDDLTSGCMTTRERGGPTVAREAVASAIALVGNTSAHLYKEDSEEFNEIRIFGREDSEQVFGDSFGSKGVKHQSPE